jgi:hypothetical protein
MTVRFSDPRGEIREAVEGVSISGYQLSLAGLDVRECPKTVDVQFVDKLIGIERLDATRERYRAYVSRQHEGIIAGTLMKRGHSISRHQSRLETCGINRNVSVVFLRWTELRTFPKMNEGPIILSYCRMSLGNTDTTNETSCSARRKASSSSLRLGS